MNYHRVLEFVSVSFERFPPKFKKFKNSLKLPGVLFSISLIICTSGGTFLNLSDNLQLQLGDIHCYNTHKLLKLLRLDTNLLSLKMLAISLFILTLFLDKSSLSNNNTKHFRHISYQLLKTNRYRIFVYYGVKLWFNVLKNTGKPIGKGAVICLYDSILSIKEGLYSIPVNYI